MGQFIEYVKMAIYSIMSNKGRTILTMLGIIIGISSVITIVSIGNGLKADVESANAGSQSVQIQVNAEEAPKPELITQDDIEAVKDTLGTRILGVDVTQGSGGSVKTRKGSFDASIMFTTADKIKNPAGEPMIAGEYFTEDHLKNGDMVAVLDRMGALYLFGTTDIVGMDIDVAIADEIHTLRIIGVMDYDEQMMEDMAQTMELYGMKMPMTVYVPYTAAETMDEPIEAFSGITLFASSSDNTKEVAKSAIKVLDSRHQNEGKKLFYEQNMEQLFKMMGKVLDGVTAFVAFVAGISLLVGGIGVMNIMLVSVTERTREIGIRKALGAKTSSIIAQFLCEAAIISGIGGIIGILIGAGLAGLIDLLNIGGLTASLSPMVILLTTAFSCGVGIVFGIYPARRAAKMSPIDALRQM